MQERGPPEGAPFRCHSLEGGAIRPEPLHGETTRSNPSPACVRKGLPPYGGRRPRGQPIREGRELDVHYLRRQLRTVLRLLEGQRLAWPCWWGERPGPD